MGTGMSNVTTLGAPSPIPFTYSPGADEDCETNGGATGIGAGSGTGVGIRRGILSSVRVAIAGWRGTPFAGDFRLADCADHAGLGIGIDEGEGEGMGDGDGDSVGDTIVTVIGGRSTSTRGDGVLDLRSDPGIIRGVRV